MRTPHPRLLPLFRSELQVRLLALMLANPDRWWGTNELRELFPAPAASLHRELHRAIDAGVLEREEVGRAYRYRAARDAPTYEPLRALLELTVGVEGELRGILDEFPEVRAAVIHGSWAHGKVDRASDVDVLVVGDVDYSRLRDAVRRLERTIGRRIDLTAYPTDQFAALERSGNGFVRGVLAGPVIALVGDLQRVVEHGQG